MARSNLQVSLKNGLIFILVLVISVGPRIHLGNLLYGKLFDIRYEDILLVLLIMTWLATSADKSLTVYLSPLGRPIGVYLGVSLLSTLIGIALGWIDSVRALFYFMKSLEYFLFFILTVNLAIDQEAASYAIGGVLVGGLANIAYGVYQMLTGNIGSPTEREFGDVYWHYGIATLGETDPAIVGAYYGMLVFFAMAGTAYFEGKWRKFMSSLCMLASALCLIGTFNRGSVWAMLFAVPAMACLMVVYRSSAKTKLCLIASLCVLALSVPFFLTLFEEYPYAKRVLEIDKAVEMYRAERVDEVYKEYFKIIEINPITGLGKSISGDLAMSADLYASAHNQYIYIVAETGIVGLAAFLYLVWRSFGYCLKGFRYSIDPAQRIISMCGIGWTIFISLMGFVQDAFVVAKTGELYWVFIALVMAVQRCQRSKSV